MQDNSFPHSAGRMPRDAAGAAWESPLDEGCNCAWKGYKDKTPMKPFPTIHPARVPLSR
jgi:hypothetical protein